MQNKNMSLPISFSVNNEISDKNNRFINVTIDVLHTGLNYNGSIFNKEVVDANIETIKNTPILGFITEVPYGDKDFKGHEYVITKDENGIGHFKDHAKKGAEMAREILNRFKFNKKKIH